MVQMGRPGLSSQQKHELRARWKAGQSLSDIGRNLGKHAGSISPLFAPAAKLPGLHKSVPATDLVAIFGEVARRNPKPPPKPSSAK